jgi:hypothetical protein
LASQSSSLAFLSKSEQPVHFGLNQIEVTEAQARSMGEPLLFRYLMVCAMI